MSRRDWLIVGVVVAFLAFLALYGRERSRAAAAAMTEGVAQESVSPEAKVETPEAEEDPTLASQEEATVAESTASRSGGAAGSCPPAEQLGPWAPSGGHGEDFEVTAARGPVHVSLWWPHGNTPWDDDEVSLVLEPGLSIEVVDGAGTAWDYPEECDRAEFDRQTQAYRDGRGDWTDFHGAVELRRLLKLGLVRIRVDNRSKTMAQPSTPQQQTAPSSGTTQAACPDGEREDHPPTVGATWTPAGEWRTVNFWTNEPGHGQSERKLLLGPDDDVALLGGGSSWSWPADCEDAARENFASNSLPEVTLDELRGEGLVR